VMFFIGYKPKTKIDDQSQTSSLDKIGKSGKKLLKGWRGQVRPMCKIYLGNRSTRICWKDRKDHEDRKDGRLDGCLDRTVPKLDFSLSQSFENNRTVSTTSCTPYTRLHSSKQTAVPSAHEQEAYPRFPWKLIPRL
jgi:hypothetical protein